MPPPEEVRSRTRSRPVSTRLCSLWPLASFRLRPRSPSRMVPVGLAHQGAQSWHPSGALTGFVGWLDVSVPFSRSRSAAPAGDRREYWPLPTFPGLRTTPSPRHLESEAPSPKPVRGSKASERPRDGRSANSRGPAVSRVCSKQRPPPSSSGSVIVRRGAA